MTVKEMREQRAKLIAEARAIYDAADKEKRARSAEDVAQFESRMADADKLEKTIVDAERLEAAERSLAASQGRQTDAGQPGSKPGTETREDRRATPEYRAAFECYLRGGWQGMGPVESRALSAENDVQGGYLVAPQQTVSELIKAIDNLVVIRQLATKFSVTSAESLGAVSLDADPADAAWTTELGTGDEDSTTAFGKRELHPHALAKQLKVSNKLLRKVPNAESLVRDRLAYKFAVSEEKAFLTGNGAGQPLGLFTASASGISTGRDVATGNTSTAITMDGLINAQYTLKDQYRRSPSVRWLFHRDAIKMIRKLRTDEGGAGTGHYIWEPSTQVGQPDMLLGVPVISSEYVPNTFTSALYVGMIADFSHYWIADALTMSVQRLIELHALTNQIGLIGRLETDGMPVLEEAFVRVKLG